MLNLNKDVELKVGWEWIKHSFYIFREKPVNFIALGIIYILMSFVPFLNAFMSPILIARFAELAECVERQHNFKFLETFDGLFKRPNLLKLSLVNLACSSIILWMIQYISELSKSNAYVSYNHILIWCGVLCVVMLVQIAMWLSPIICAYNKNIGPFTAMWWSIKAGLYNIPTLLLYVLLTMVITVLALIPLGLGLIIWLPILNISCYFIYQTLFVTSHVYDKL